jgi:predicted naringenin-chalcone synthase
MNLIAHDSVSSTCVICGRRNCDHLRQNIERIRTAFSYEMDETVTAAINSLWSDPGQIMFTPYMPLHVSRVTQNGVHTFVWETIRTIADLKRVIKGQGIKTFVYMNPWVG